MSCDSTLSIGLSFQFLFSISGNLVAENILSQSIKWKTAYVRLHRLKLFSKFEDAVFVHSQRECCSQEITGDDLFRLDRSVVHFEDASDDENAALYYIAGYIHVQHKFLPIHHPCVLPAVNLLSLFLEDAYLFFLNPYFNLAESLTCKILLISFPISRLAISV